LLEGALKITKYILLGDNKRNSHTYFKSANKFLLRYQSKWNSHNSPTQWIITIELLCSQPTGHMQCVEEQTSRPVGTSLNTFAARTVRVNDVSSVA